MLNSGRLVLRRKEDESITILKDGVELATVKCRNRDVLTIRAASNM